MVEGLRKACARGRWAFGGMGVHAGLLLVEEWGAGVLKLEDKGFARTTTVTTGLGAET